MRTADCDDPRIQTARYDFDAHRTLQSTTLVWARPAEAHAPIFSERLLVL